jgi:hypothetical protein
MAFPTIATTATDGQASNTTTHVFDLPAGVVSGDLLIMIASFNQNPSTTWPAGWTQLFSTNAAGDIKHEARYRIADGTEGATITITTGASIQSSSVALRITGHAGAGMPPQAGTPSTGSSAAPDPPALTPTGGAKDYLWIECCGGEGNQPAGVYASTNYTGIVAHGVGGGSSGATTEVAYRNLNAPSENPGAMTIGDNISWVAGTLAVHPVSAVQAYVDLPGRLRLWAPAWRDTAASLRLWVRGYLDTASRVVLSVVPVRDAAARVRVTVVGATYPGLTSTSTLAPPTSGPYAYATWNPTDPVFPSVGASYVDPVFGLTVTRLSDGAGGTGSGIIYGVNGRWNADGTRYMHDSPATGVDIINAITGAVTHSNVPYPYTTTDEVSFDPIDSDLYYYTNGVNLMQYRLSTTTSTVLKTFPATLGGLGQSGDWIDRTGRWFALNIGGMIRLWDKQRNVLYAGSAPITEIPPGWAGITPDGQYLVRSLNPEHWSYKIDHRRCTVGPGVMFWDACFDHGNVISTTGNRSYFVTGACRYGSQFNGAWRVILSLNQTAAGAAQHNSPNLRIVEIPGTGGSLFDCAAKGIYQDWGTVSHRDDTDVIGSPGTWTPYRQEIIAFNVRQPAAVHRLCHHRSSDQSQFCRQSRANLNWDGSKIAFVSNMHLNGSGGSCGYADLYVLNI